VPVTYGELMRWWIREIQSLMEKKLQVRLGGGIVAETFF
jgi:hypothetical protein